VLLQLCFLEGGHRLWVGQYRGPPSDRAVADPRLLDRLAGRGLAAGGDARPSAGSRCGGAYTRLRFVAETVSCRAVDAAAGDRFIATCRAPPCGRETPGRSAMAIVKPLARVRRNYIWTHADQAQDG
jgi:hypothetical protein